MDTTQDTGHGTRLDVNDDARTDTIYVSLMRDDICLAWTEAPTMEEAQRMVTFLMDQGTEQVRDGCDFNAWCTMWLLDIGAL